MKGLFKAKSKTPVELVQCVRELLLFVLNHAETRERKREEKMGELGKLILETRTVLYGDGQCEPSADACSQLTQEFFASDTLRLLIACLPKLELGARKNATHVIANLQRQKVSGRLIASEYLEKNLDIMDILLPSYEEGDLALIYGAISRECLRHQVVASYVLNERNAKRAFSYIQLPNFEIASDAQATFRELMTRHKSTVAEFLSTNYDWFFHEYNTQLIESPNYLTRRYAVKLLADMLLHRSNTTVMVRYVSSFDNLRILMNLFKDPKKSIHLETFQVFKLFVANQNKPPEVIGILVKNKDKLLRFLDGLTTEKEDEKFEADKLQVINEISSLEIGDRPDPDSSKSCPDES